MPPTTSRAAIRQTVIVGDGGVVQVRSGDLPPGATAEVVVRVAEGPVASLAPKAPRRTLSSFIGAGKGSFANIKEVDDHVRATRPTNAGRLTAIAGRTVYLDANLLIYAMEDFGSVGGKVRDLFARIDAGELDGVTSELTLAEVLVKPLRDGATAIAGEYRELLDPDGPLLVTPVSRAVLVRAAEVRSSSSLKLPDAIHVATAELLGCGTLLTNDAGFLAWPASPVLLLADY